MQTVLLVIVFVVVGCAPIKTEIISTNQSPEGVAGVGDVLVRLELRESLPNAFGKADVFGRTRERGYSEIRFCGLTNDGKAVFRRKDVDIFSTETTMSHGQIKTGSMYGSVSGISQQGLSSGSVTATGTSVTMGGYGSAQPLPPDTVEIVVDFPKERTIVMRGKVIELLEVTSSSVRYSLK